MAMIYHGNSEIQGGDGLQTLILMNHAGYVGYPDTNPQQPPQQGNFVFLNPATAGNTLNHANLGHAPPSQTQQFVGIPLQSTPSTTISSLSQDREHDISALQGFVHRVEYNMYNPAEHTEARDITRSQQRLSLTLSSQQPGYGSFRPEREIQSQDRAAAISPPTNGYEVIVSGGLSPSASGISNGVNGVQGMLLNSKYLKAAQELLDEVVNVGKGVKNITGSGKGANGQSKTIGKSPTGAIETGDGTNGGENSAKRDADLTTAERQEIQMKKGKLVNMLEEVEQRFRQYHHQMQIVITWFEQVAGIASAKTYTALALRTISKQFRCLKDAILGQIRAASKTLGEEDIMGGKAVGSKLKFVDNQIRQQRALQQLGMIQHNVWRPQRGLPERAVSVLRAWLFEHFLHPYPKDSDKIMLAKQTGLTRSQVSNWFINARVRLWKPMVEEMYTEETKEREQNGSEDKTSKSEQNEDTASKSSNAAQEMSPSLGNQNRYFKHEQITAPVLEATATSNSTAGICHGQSHSGINMQNSPGFNLMRISEMDSIRQGSPKKSRSNEMLHSPTSVQSIYMDAKNGGETNKQETMKFGNEGQNRDGFTLIGGPTNFMGGFGSYPIGEIGSRIGFEQFPAAPYSGSSGSVSLTLGLQHCDNLSLSGTHHQTFRPNQTIQLGRGAQVGDEPNEFSAPMSTPHSTNVYENFNIQNRKMLAAQLLPDFVT